MMEQLANEQRILKRLAKIISCDFVDTRTTSKDFVRLTAQNNIDRTFDQGFLLSTCLRYEAYHFDKARIDDSSSFFHVSGHACIRRLLSLMVGLQSEITGEKEIMMQITKSITDAHHDGHLSDNIYADLTELMALAKKIRDQFYIDNPENYSTIAANMFVDYLRSHPDSTIAIIGGGYMADKFFEALLRASETKIKKVIWMNRSTSKIENAIIEISHLLDFEIEVLNLTEGGLALKEADAVFCAIANSPDVYSGPILKEGAFVVDVSYPQVFEDSNDIKLVNIANTSFSHLVKNAVPLANITLANKAIDNLVKELY